MLIFHKYNKVNSIKVYDKKTMRYIKQIQNRNFEKSVFNLLL